MTRMNNTRISRLKTILVKEECQEERKALSESDKVAKIKEFNNDPYFKHIQETYPRGRFTYTPTDWVRRQEIFNAEPISMDEASGYLYTHKSNYLIKHYLKVLGVMVFLCFL